MENSMIFSSISAQDLAQMMDCFGGHEEHFTVGQTVMQYRDGLRQIGILLSGEAQLVRYDYDGNCSILETLEEDSVFGELFALPMAEDEFSVECTKDCSVLFLDYERMMTRCKRGCKCHDILVRNMLELVSRKVQRLSQRLEVLSQRTIRGKVLCYFGMLSRRENSKSFTLPFSMSSLVDYLCVDRSAMLREMKKLRTEGVLDSSGKNVTLLK